MERLCAAVVQMPARTTLRELHLGGFYPPCAGWKSMFTAAAAAAPGCCFPQLTYLVAPSRVFEYGRNGRDMGLLQSSHVQLMVDGCPALQRLDARSMHIVPQLTGL